MLPPHFVGRFAAAKRVGSRRLPIALDCRFALGTQPALIGTRPFPPGTPGDRRGLTQPHPELNDRLCLSPTGATAVLFYSDHHGPPGSGFPNRHIFAQCSSRNFKRGENELMETFKLVMPENLNHYGYLFGGYMLKWVDEIAWVAATLEYPHHRFVTIGMDKIEFKHGVRQGTILRFVVNRVRVGNTSVSYLVNVYRDHESGPEHSIFTTTVTMVNVDDAGNKQPLDARVEEFDG